MGCTAQIPRFAPQPAIRVGRRGTIDRIYQEQMSGSRHLLVIPRSSSIPLATTFTATPAAVRHAWSSVAIFHAGSRLRHLTLHSGYRIVRRRYRQVRRVVEVEVGVKQATRKLALVCWLFLCVAIASSSSRAAEDIIIGGGLTLSGSAAAYGEDGRTGPTSPWPPSTPKAASWGASCGSTTMTPAPTPGGCRLRKYAANPDVVAMLSISSIELVALDPLANAPRFADQAPAEIYASLLDEGVYHCSIRPMYRILGQHGEVRERREQLRHPAYRKPELIAERPNQVWSWDITKLMGPTKWSYFLYLHHSRHLQSPRGGLVCG